MPWQFTTPLNVGDLDPNAPAGVYTHCRAFLLGNYPDPFEPPFLRVNISYGWYAAGSYVPSPLVPVGREAAVRIEGADYVTLVTTHEPDPGEKTYAAAKRAVYEKLAALGMIPDGSVA